MQEERTDGDFARRFDTELEHIDPEAFDAALAFERMAAVELVPAEITGLVQGSDLDKEKVARTLAGFHESFEILSADIEQEALAIVVTDESQTDLIESARELRRKIQHIRLRTEGIRKPLKEASLREGQLIDGIGRTVRRKCEALEAHLQTQEDFVAIAERKRLDERQAQRLAEIESYGVPIDPAELRSMSEEMYKIFADGCRASFELKQEADRSAKEAREIAERESREREATLRAENARLAEEKAEADRKAREAEEISRQADLDRQKAEAELRQKEAAEAEARRQVELAAERLAMAPDAEKLYAFAESIKSVQLPAAASETGIRLFATIGDRQRSLYDEIIAAARSLEHADQGGSHAGQ